MTDVTPDLAKAVRRTIARQIDELIMLLDQIDGDPDLEDDELRDDALDIGEDNVLSNLVPVYGADQTGRVVAWGDRAGATQAAGCAKTLHSARSGRGCPEPSQCGS